MSVANSGPVSEEDPDSTNSEAGEGAETTAAPSSSQQNTKAQQNVQTAVGTSSLRGH